MDEASIAARLNRLPVTRTHKLTMAIAGIGTFFDLYDIFLAGVLGTVLTKQFHLNALLLPLVLGSGFLGMFFGALFMGLLADRLGRRTAFLVNLTLYSLFTLLGAFSANVAMLVVFRFIAGIGIGAEPPLVDSYISDVFPARFRGRYVAWAYTIAFLGIPVVGFLAMFLVPLHPLGWEGWRWLFVIGCLGAVIVLFLRRNLPESPRWLESVGRRAEAEAITRKMEQEALAAYGEGSLPVPKEEEVKMVRRLPYRILFSSQYAGRTVMLWVFQILQTIGYYGFGTLVPIVLAAKGFSVVHSLTYTAFSFVGYPIGSLLSVPVVERLDRKWLIVWSAGLMGVFGLALGYSTTPAAIVTCGFLYTVVSNIFSNAFHVFQAEIFPTFARVTATSTAYSLSRLSSGLMPFLLLPVLHQAGPLVMFAVVALAMLCLMIDIGVFAPSTTGRDLEEVNVVA